MIVLNLFSLFIHLLRSLCLFLAWLLAWLLYLPLSLDWI
nr:MAG TPA: hypothetical protein [Caudoviricetes sp.]